MGFFSSLTGTDKYGAAQSALIAKYMYNQMSASEKEGLRSKALELLQSGNPSPEWAAKRFDRLTEPERFCLYSTTMDMIGIPPVLKGILYKDEWYSIPNPFVALIKAEKQLMAAQHEIKKKCGVDISFA